LSHALRLTPADTSPFDARLFVTQWLRRWGYRPLIPAAALLTSELATNAVIHARAPFRVEVANTGQGVRVAVHDPSPGVPALRPPAEVTAHGRGLRIVDAVAALWGVEPIAEGGKEVWFELRVTDENSRLLEGAPQSRAGD
jgi:hypothetical protein